MRNIILLALVGGTLLLGLVVCESIFGYYYYKYRHIVDERLQKPLFEQTAKIYAAPKELRVGQKLTPQTVAQELRNAGYSGDERSRQVADGHLRAQRCQHHDPARAAVVPLRTGRHGHVRQRSWSARSPAMAARRWTLMSWSQQLITGLSEGQNRTKRRLVTFNELPPNLVNAVTSIEDRRFFDHGGVDYFRLLGGPA